MTRTQRGTSGRKTFVVDVKAIKDGSDGGKPGFVGYASIFGNVDSYGDVMEKGAFAKTLAEDYGDEGAGVPVYWSHRMDDPMMNIGVTLTAKEDDTGLLVDVEFGTETEVERQVARLVKTGRARQMSFAFDYVDAAWETRDGRDVYSVKAVKLHEVSVVAVGANQETSILSAKARELTGRKSEPESEAEVEPETKETAEVDVEALRAIVDGLASMKEQLETLTTAVADALGDDEGEGEDDGSDADGQLSASTITPDDAADVDAEAAPKSAPTYAERARLLADVDALSSAERGF